MEKKLLHSAEDFNQEGMDHYVDNDIKHALANLSISFELLGKSFLAGVDPALIIDKDFDSLLHVCGAGKHARKSPVNIKTIGAHEVIKRCSQILPKIKDYEVGLGLLADARNGVLHFGECEAEMAKQVFVPYLKCTKVLLEAIGVDFEKYFGEFHKFVTTMLLESAKEIDVEVERLITKAKSNFQKKFKEIPGPTRKNIIQTVIDNYVLDKYNEVLTECPVCKNDGVVSGSHEVVSWEAEFDRDGSPEGAYPIVELYADSFKCNICGLALDTSAELEAAGIETVIKLNDVDSNDFIELNSDDISD